MLLNLVWSLCLLATGVMTGLFFMGTVVLEPAVEQLPSDAHLLFRQQLIPRLRRLAPPLMIVVLLCSVCVTVWGSKGISQVFLGGSSALSAFILLTTFFGNVPLNEQFSAWEASDLPLNWQELVARWSLFDRVRCVASLAIFGLQLTALFWGGVV
jgi:uncharacterized membrane protein